VPFDKSEMTRTIHWLFRSAVAALSAAIIALAVLSIAMRLLLPHADGLRETLVARLADKLGVAVEVGTLSIQLRGLTPTLSFANARLLAPTDAATDPGQTLLAARTLRVELDLLATLKAQRARIDAISLVGAELQVQRDENGNIRLLGLDAMQGGDARALDFFLREGRFRLLDSRLRWRDLTSKAPPQAFLIEIAELANQGRHHDLRVQARTIDAPAGAAARPDKGRHPSLGDEIAAARQTGELQILGKLNGPPQHPARWSGQVYLRVDGGDLKPIMGRLLPVQPSISSGSFQIQSWNQLAEGELTESLTRLGITQVDIMGEKSERLVRLGDLAGLARWQREAEGWQLDISNLELPGLDRQAPTSAHLRYHRLPQAPENEGPAPIADLFATIGALEIGPILQAIIVFAPDPPDPVIALGQRGVHGLTRNLAIRMELIRDNEAAPALRATTARVSEEPQTSSAAQPQPRGEKPLPRLEPGEPDWTGLAVGDWRLRAEIEQAAVDPSASNGAAVANDTEVNLPTFSGLDLKLDFGPRGGYASIGSNDLRIDLRPLFGQPHRFTRIDGNLAWRMMPAGSIHLWSEAISADTSNLETSTRVSLCLHPSGASPFVDLQTHLHNGRIAALPRWLPVGIMDDRLERWLLQAIVDGQLESGDLLLRGPLDRFPFDDQEGRFILELRAVDGVLDYGIAAQGANAGPGMRSAENRQRLSWPPLRQVAAMVRFENRSLEIQVPSAEILNSRVDAGRVSMPNLWQPSYLEINARGEGPLADGMHVLATSPLAYQLGGLASTIEVDGYGSIQLELGVPLNRALPFRYAGQLIWNPPSKPAGEVDGGGSAQGSTQLGAEPAGQPTPVAQGSSNSNRTLRINGTDLQFGQITGRLRFDDSGIQAEGIRARTGQQALLVDVQTLDGGTADARTQIDLRGQTTVERLAKSLPSSLWTLTSGALDWQLGLSLRNRDAAQQRPPIDFALRSNLRGLALSLPAPLGKSADQPRQLELGGRFQEQWPLTLQLEYDTIGSRMELDRQPSGRIVLQRLAVDLNGQPRALPPERSVAIAGEVRDLALQPWLDWLDRASLESLLGGDNRSRLRLLPIELQVGVLDVGILQLDDLEAVLSPGSAGAWDIRFSTKQTGNSQINLPAPAAKREQPLRVSLEQLDVEPIVSAHDGPTPEPRSVSRTDPRQLGRLDIKVDRLRYGDDLIGKLQIQSQPAANGARFETLTLTGPHVDATGSGDWLIDATDYIESSLRLSAKSSAAGELLRESGFYSALSGAPGELELDLRWPGGPGKLSLARARGSMAIEIGAGRMLEMEPGVGRMLGILNTGALSRRLSLDFSDVFDDGFSFDSIAGDIAIGSGEATIRALNIVAPPADIRITGRTNLVDGLLDQQVEVTPKIGVGLALAGAVAGGPVVGAAVFLADRVTDGAVERLGRYAYKVSGPWRDPVIRRVDTGGSPSVGNLFVDDAPTNDSAVNSSSPNEIDGTQAVTKDAGSSSSGEPTSPFLDDL
jgi:uncharacterized protein YhdP